MHAAGLCEPLRAGREFTSEARINRRVFRCNLVEDSSIPFRARRPRSCRRREASHASHSRPGLATWSARDALPLLVRASCVELISFADADRGDLSSRRGVLEQVAAQLGRQGVQATTTLLCRMRPWPKPSCRMLRTCASAPCVSQSFGASPSGVVWHAPAAGTVRHVPHG